MKIVLIGGAGGIGSSVAFNLLRTQTPYDIVVVDNRDNMITSHVMDLQDALSLGGARSIRGGTASDALDADIVVVSAAVPLRLNTSRDVFLHDNASLLAGIVDPLVASGWSGVFILMTNPVDPLLTWLSRRTGWSRNHLLGYTLNDTQRFRTGIAVALGIAPQTVTGVVVGEHGAGQVPVWSSVRVNGKPVTLTSAQRDIVLDYIDNWYIRHVALDSARTSTWSSGLGGALMVEAVVHGTEDPFPASVILEGSYGVMGISSSTPCILGPTGLVRVLEEPLESEELAKFAGVARKIGELADSITV
ncbi:L-lactate dehydrogenase [Alpinimonas psychrophila]|uniref:Malate/lactate dehydrogenase n=1 Tax=Alpinimonas psychrophila TaxID=748908 RepID=A0A7W3PPB7_9MICO|nr:malate dehydrogenase [Alpinimonas psychrophila]MBA8829111.1 malate/lactate dehydrogenase [Alpinimonas psychrophila]